MYQNYVLNFLLEWTRVRNSLLYRDRFSSRMNIEISNPINLILNLEIQNGTRRNVFLALQMTPSTLNFRSDLLRFQVFFHTIFDPVY